MAFWINDLQEYPVAMRAAAPLLGLFLPHPFLSYDTLSRQKMMWWEVSIPGVHQSLCSRPQTAASVQMPLRPRWFMARRSAPSWVKPTWVSRAREASLTGLTRASRRCGPITSNANATKSRRFVSGCGCAANQFAGTAIWKVDPSPTTLSTVTLPPWAWATCLTIAKPSPVPPRSRLRPRSTR